MPQFATASDIASYGVHQGRTGRERRYTRSKHQHLAGINARCNRAGRNGRDAGARWVFPPQGLEPAALVAERLWKAELYLL